jgi:hypothetical protein
MPSLQPRLPRTDYSQAGCYLSHTNDCSRGITGEHYVSRTALEELSEPVVAIDGVHWLAPGEQRVIGINSLTAKILCGRHNSALSPLDDEGGQFLRTIKSIHASLGKKSLSRKTLVSIVSGEALEIWILKIACGLFYSKIASQNRQILSDHAIDDSIIAEGFFSAVIFDPRGASPEQLAAEGWRLRPTDVSFRTNQRTHWLILTWPAGVPSRVIEMTMAR